MPTCKNNIELHSYPKYYFTLAVHSAPNEPFDIRSLTYTFFCQTKYNIYINFPDSSLTLFHLISNKGANKIEETKLKINENVENKIG